MTFKGKMTLKELESILIFEIKLRDERWDTLRKYIENEIPNLNIPPSVILDYLTGYGNALKDTLNEMEELDPINTDSINYRKMWEELKEWIVGYTYHVPQPFILSKMKELEEK